LSAVSDLYQNVLVIGHNPDLHSWVLSMAQREACPDKLVSDYPTSALTHLQWHAPAWYPLPRYQANVLAFVTGKMLLADML
jgi:phosphohistidine phosphatase SixA